MILLFSLIDPITLLIALIIGFIWRENKSLNPIRLFLFAGFVEKILVIFLPNTKESILTYRLEVNLISMLDLTIIYYYFSTLLTDKITRIWLLLCYSLIVCVGIYYLIIRPDGLTHFNSVFYGIQNLFITVPCILYLYSVFRSEDDNDLKTNPHFIATCGILFFYATTFPFYITYKTVLDVTSQMTLIFGGINALLNSILFITFMKAFLCPYPEQR